MSVGSNDNILALTNIQAKTLAGSLLAIGDEVYRFKDYDPAYPGQPPWRSGAEGKAYPLLGSDGSVAAYLKFFTRPTQKRLDRTAWLIGQQMHTWLPGLAAAPLLWVDTRPGARSREIDFDFAGCLAQAVPGETWLELKHRTVDAGAPLPDDFRWRCVEDLVLATAVLERAGIVHGDLSPNNIVVDLNAPPHEPALYLIDFDAFVAPAIGPDHAVGVAEGGTFGTDGYCPPDLGLRAAEGDGAVSPYSDRYGRDVLILELLLMDAVLSPDDPPASWIESRLKQRYAAWQASCDPARREKLSHLDPPGVFALAEPDRPSSTQLAAALGLELPESPVICTDVQIEQSPLAMPRNRSVSARVQRRPSRRPASPRVHKHSRQAAPAQSQPLNRWLVPVQVVTRSLRRVQKPSLPKDDPVAAFVVMLIFALFWIALMIFPLYSCRGMPPLN